jgi:hypothetical protein
MIDMTTMPDETADLLMQVAGPRLMKPTSHDLCYRDARARIARSTGCPT